MKVMTILGWSIDEINTSNARSFPCCRSNARWKITLSDVWCESSTASEDGSHFFRSPLSRRLRGWLLISIFLHSRLVRWCQHKIRREEIDDAWYTGSSEGEKIQLRRRKWEINNLQRAPAFTHNRRESVSEEFPSPLGSQTFIHPHYSTICSDGYVLKISWLLLAQ